MARALESQELKLGRRWLEMAQEALALGVREAAAAVGLSHWTVRRFIAEGKIRPIRIGRRVLIEPAELERFIERSSQPHVCRSGAGVRRANSCRDSGTGLGTQPSDHLF